MNMFPPIIIKCHTPLNTSNSIKVKINTSHAMCNMQYECPTNDGENIVLNKFNTSVALRNFNHCIYLALYFFLHLHVKVCKTLIICTNFCPLYCTFDYIVDVNLN